ncbi:unnamed protein product [Prorocentrum cordatum]|uniref:Uncharacterized protein n=1 Tax=Prorocentrum cordatum TaxID=2364126 RepID=A0ABN9XMB1_9DINO|nr:unnamed protein product [Polarella glacialis]
MTAPLPAAGGSTRRDIKDHLEATLTAAELSTVGKRNVQDGVIYIELKSRAHMDAIVTKLRADPIDTAEFGDRQARDGRLRQKRERQEEAVQGASSQTAQLLALFGTGGSSKAKRKFAKSIAGTLEISTRASSSGLRLKGMTEQKAESEERDEDGEE